VEAPTFYLDNRLTDGGKFVSPTRRLSFIAQENSWYLFLLEAAISQGRRTESSTQCEMLA
jgi:hypothetical protein